MGYNQNNAGLSSVEYERKKSKRITCNDCEHYIESDRSCSTTAIVAPHDGWDSWKYCKHFALDESCDFYHEKQSYIMKNPRIHDATRRNDEQGKKVTIIIPERSSNGIIEKNKGIGQEIPSDFEENVSLLYSAFRESVAKKRLRRVLRELGNYEAAYNKIYNDQVKHLTTTYGISNKAAKLAIYLYDNDLHRPSLLVEEYLDDFRDEKKISLYDRNKKNWIQKIENHIFDSVFIKQLRHMGSHLEIQRINYKLHMRIDFQKALDLLLGTRRSHQHRKRGHRQR